MTIGEGTKFVPYEIAQYIVRYYQIKSRNQYWKWHRKNKIKYLPRYPNRVYKNWEGWNLFLGQNNTFEDIKNKPQKPVRPFWEAVRWAQAAAKKHGLKTRGDWVKFYKEGNVPDDIPCYPDHSYGQEFIGRGWTVWLGQTIGGKLMSERENIGLFAVMKYKTNQQPTNMIVTKLFRNGESEGKEFLETRPDLMVLKAYKWDPDQSNEIKEMIETLASDQGDDNYLVNNLNDLLFELSTRLEPWQT